MHKTIIGRIVHGIGKGASLGFPTINLDCEGIELVFGVYSAKVYTRRCVFLGALHYGPRKIFGLIKPILEVHLLDFQGDLYGKKVKIEIIRKVRDTKDFTSPFDLKKQIERDIIIIKEGLPRPKRSGG